MTPTLPTNQITTSPQKKIKPKMALINTSETGSQKNSPPPALMSSQHTLTQYVFFGGCERRVCSTHTHLPKSWLVQNSGKRVWGVVCVCVSVGRVAHFSVTQCTVVFSEWEGRGYEGGMRVRVGRIIVWVWGMGTTLFFCEFWCTILYWGKHALLEESCPVADVHGC